FAVLLVVFLLLLELFVLLFQFHILLDPSPVGIALRGELLQDGPDLLEFLRALRPLVAGPGTEALVSRLRRLQPGLPEHLPDGPAGESDVLRQVSDPDLRHRYPSDLCEVLGAVQCDYIEQGPYL